MWGVGRYEEGSLKKPRLHYIKWFFSCYREYVPSVMLLLFMTVISTTVTVLYPRLFKYMIDMLTRNLELFQDGKISMARAMMERNRVLKLLFLIGIGMIIKNLYPFMRARMNLKFEMFFRSKYFRLMMEKSYAFFLRFRTGDLVTRLSEDVSTHPPGISWTLCSGIFRAFDSSCIIFFCVVSMMTMSVKLTMAAILPLPFMMVIYLKLRKVIEKRFMVRQKTVSETNDFLESSYAGVKIVKSFNSEKTQIEKFDQLLEHRIEKEVDVIAIQGLMQVFFQFLGYIGQVMVILLGGIMVIRNEITMGDYYAFFAYMGMIVWPLIDIPMLFVSSSQSFVIIDRLDAIEEFEPGYCDSDSGDIPVEGFREMELQDVCFTYPSAPEKGDEEKSVPGDGDGKDSGEEPFSIRNISFKLNKGEKVAIVGKIASGKTTLLELVSGFLLPGTGCIRINGTEMSGLDRESFRKKLGYVQQEALIFSESVRKNIEFWRGGDNEWSETCAQYAQLHDEILKFPGGYDEKIGQRGVTLSGGQRQRLSIARALYGRPELFLMDDVTSSLDAENELVFWNSVFSLFEGLTCLIVTHRMSTAQKADRIIVLNNGTIEATGTHEELMGKSETYRELITK